MRVFSELSNNNRDGLTGEVLETEDRACVMLLTVHKDRLKGVKHTKDVMKGMYAAGR